MKSSDNKGTIRESVFMFPQVAQWLGYVFPTYYVVEPVVDLSVNGLGFSSTALNLVVLGIIIIIMALVVRTIVSRLSTQELRLSV